VNRRTLLGTGALAAPTILARAAIARVRKIATNQRIDCADSSAARPKALTYMVGYGGGANEASVPTVERWLGRPLDLITDSTTTWGFSRTGFTSANGRPTCRIISVPMLSVEGEHPSLNDMAQAARGAYDSDYRVMLTNVLRHAPTVAIRPGWEGPGGDWYQWSNGVGKNATYANFIATFRRIARIAKSIQPSILIDFCACWGYHPDITSYWPGTYDAATNPGGADVVSLDVYEGNVARANNGGIQPTWAGIQSYTGLSNPPVAGTWNLDTLVAFARAHGVKVGMAEYGPGTAAMSHGFLGGEGSGYSSDDAAWAQGSIDWINSLGSLFLYTVWSAWPPADDMESSRVGPAEHTVWKNMWGSTYFDRNLGGWYNGTARTPSER
jgi:hypothetical protein